MHPHLTSLAGLSLLVGSLAGLTGCSDHAGELEAARKAKNTPRPGGSAAPETTLPGTTMAPGGSSIPTQTPTTPTSGTCQPRTVGQIAVPAWRPPNQLHRPLCTQQEATSIVTCYVSQSQAACDTTVSGGCHDCIISDATDPSFGAIVYDSARKDIELNVEGCVAALSGDVSANGCGPRMKAAELCKLQSCAGCTDQTQLLACANAAAQGPCAQYEAAARACSQQYLGTCMPTQDRMQLAYALARNFCM